MHHLLPTNRDPPATAGGGAGLLISPHPAIQQALDADAGPTTARAATGYQLPLDSLAIIRIRLLSYIALGLCTCHAIGV